jgi:hypothetical protein
MTLLDAQMLPTKSVPFGPATGKAGWRHMHAVMGLQEGVIGAGDFKAAQRAAGANKSVDVPAGDAWIQGDDTARQGIYHQNNDATINVVTPDNTSGNPRFDQLILRVYDSSIAGASDTPTLEIVQGTPNGATTIDNRLGAGALPNGAIRLAEWVAPNAYTQVTTAMIRDRRPWARGFRRRMIRTAGDQSYASGAQAVDSATFGARLECSGNPVLATVKMIAQNNTAGVTVTTSILLNTSLVVSDGGQTAWKLNGCAFGGVGIDTNIGGADMIIPPAGSQLFGLAITPSAGTTVVRSSAGTSCSVALTELVGGDAANTGA